MNSRCYYYLKGTRIQSQFFNSVEKSIPYAKINPAEKKFVILQTFHLRISNIVR